jgi:tetratricopeptide (TPR) repeat protein
MKTKSTISIALLVIVLLSIFSVPLLSTNSNDDTNKEPTSKKIEELTVKVKHLENILDKRNSLLDNAYLASEKIDEKLKTFNFHISVLNATIQFLIALIAFLGFFVYFRSRQYSKQVKDDLQEIDALKKKASESIKPEILIELSSLEAKLSSQFDSSLKSLDKRVDTLYANLPKSDSPTNFLAKATHNYNTGLYDQAESLYESELSMDPYSINAMVGLANVYLQQGKLEEALGKLDKAIALDEIEPKFNALGQISVIKAETLIQLGRIDEALTLLNEIKKQNKNYKKVDRLLELCHKK